jgi:hypothetical protein
MKISTNRFSTILGTFPGVAGETLSFGKVLVKYQLGRHHSVGWKPR